MHCVDLGESFQTHIFLQNLASIQPRTTPVKLARGSPCTDPQGAHPRGAPASAEAERQRHARPRVHLRRRAGLLVLQLRGEDYSAAALSDATGLNAAYRRLGSEWLDS